MSSVARTSEFAAVIERIAPALPQAVRHTFQGAGHVPHATHPRDYVARVEAFLSTAAEAGASSPRAHAAPVDDPAAG